MNERIQQLADREMKAQGPVATIGNWGRVEWADNVYPQLGDKLYAAVDLEKFAELIVRECAIQCTTEGPFVAEVVWGKQFHKKILEHFGVEE